MQDEFSAQASGQPFCVIPWMSLTLQPTGSTSRRQHFLKRFRPYFHGIGFDTADGARLVHAEISFSNTCHLKCRMCSSQFSSSWITEDAEFLNEGHLYRKVDPNWLRKRTSTVQQISDLREKADHPELKRELESVMTWLRLPEQGYQHHGQPLESLLKEFIHFTHTLDEKRGTDVGEVVPQLRTLFQESI